jgi:hypothetical protein
MQRSAKKPGPLMAPEILLKLKRYLTVVLLNGRLLDVQCYVVKNE